MQHAISNADTCTAHYLAEQDHQESCERALETMHLVVLNDIQQGDPQTTSAFADYCAENLDGEVALALCLARINHDQGLQALAIAELQSHVDKSRAAFCAKEVERRIAHQQAQAEAQAMFSQELIHA